MENQWKGRIENASSVIIKENASPLERLNPLIMPC